MPGCVNSEVGRPESYTANPLVNKGDLVEGIVA